MYLLPIEKLATVITTPCLASFSNNKHYFIFLFSERPIGDVSAGIQYFRHSLFQGQSAAFTNLSIFKGMDDISFVTFWGLKMCDKMAISSYILKMVEKNPFLKLPNES